MQGKGETFAEICGYRAHFPLRPSQETGNQLPDGIVIEIMSPGAVALNLDEPGHSLHGLHFIGDHRIAGSYEKIARTLLKGSDCHDHGGRHIAGVFETGVLEVLQHLGRDTIGSGGNRFHKSAAERDAVQRIHRDSPVHHPGDHPFHAVFRSIDIVGRKVQFRFVYFLDTFEIRHFGGCHGRIDNQEPFPFPGGPVGGMGLQETAHDDARVGVQPLHPDKHAEDSAHQFVYAGRAGNCPQRLCHRGEFNLGIMHRGFIGAIAHPPGNIFKPRLTGGFELAFVRTQTDAGFPDLRDRLYDSLLMIHVITFLFPELFSPPNSD